MRKKITDDTILVRNESIPSASIDGEIGLMNIDTGKYYSLNPIGTDIWNNLNKPTSFNNLVTLLMSEYEIDREECASQVRKFVERLIQEGIVLIG